MIYNVNFNWFKHIFNMRISFSVFVFTITQVTSKQYEITMVLVEIRWELFLGTQYSCLEHVIDLIPFAYDRKVFEVSPPGKIFSSPIPKCRLILENSEKKGQYKAHFLGTDFGKGRVLIPFACERVTFGASPPANCFFWFTTKRR